MPGEIGALVALPSGSLSVWSVVSCSTMTVKVIALPASAGCPKPRPAARASAETPLASPRPRMDPPVIDLPFLDLDCRPQVGFRQG